MTKEKVSNHFSLSYFHTLSLSLVAHFEDTINYKVSWQRLFHSLSSNFVCSHFVCVCVRASVWKHVNWIGNWEILCRNFWGKLNLKEMKKKKKITKNDQSTIYFWHGIFQNQMFKYTDYSPNSNTSGNDDNEEIKLDGNTCALAFWSWNKKWVISIKSWRAGNKAIHARSYKCLHAHCIFTFNQI